MEFKKLMKSAASEADRHAGKTGVDILSELKVEHRSANCMKNRLSSGLMHSGVVSFGYLPLHECISRLLHQVFPPSTLSRSHFVAHTNTHTGKLS